ncbi:MAG: hypothetical protein LBQ54_08275 [Planctomycetaceae bacterium]|nr:hypothetical protein [Planctomycetaceae bacterium]
MPPGSGRPLHPCRLTLTSFGSPPDRKSFQPEAEWNAVTMRQSRWNGTFPPGLSELNLTHKFSTFPKTMI